MTAAATAARSATNLPDFDDDASVSKLPDIVRKHAAARPDSPALTCDGVTITYGELDQRSNQVAQALIAAGVGPQEHVAILEKNGIEYFEVLFGATKADAICVPVNFRLAPPEIAQIVTDAQANVFVVGPDFTPVLDAIADQLDPALTVVVLGGHPGSLTYADWVSAQEPVDPELPVSPEDVAIQLYTSGTTGLPKGVMLTYRNMGVLAPFMSPSWGLDQSSVNLCAMPLFHIAGAGWASIGLWHGCHSLLIRDLDPMTLVELMETEGVTNGFLVPALIQFVLLTPGVADRDWSKLRSLVYGASPITTDVLTKAVKTFGCDLFQAYGATETTGTICELPAVDHDPFGPRAHLLRSAGKPLPWVDMRIADIATGEELPTGEVGEVWVRSGQTMKGYWNKPAETAKVITEDRWYKTGDGGYLDSEGYLFLTDRIKDMVVSGGENVYPIEVENVLGTHPDVVEAAVIGVPSEKWGETVKAVVVLGADATVTGPELIAYCRERLAGFKCPTSVDFVEALPRNPSGKILKKDLRAPFWADQGRAIS